MSSRLLAIRAALSGKGIGNAIKDLKKDEKIALIIGTIGATGVAISAGATSLGFTSAGIAAGSIAAGLQAGIGNVVAGSAFATAQSLGATGAIAIIGTTGGVILVGAGGYCAYR